jgi:hypothetical protein
MKLKKRIRKLEADIAQLKKVVQNDSITLTDQSDPKRKVVMSFRANAFLTEKITTTITENSDTITKDQSN